MMPQRILGGVSLLMGLTIVAWFVYNLIRPTPAFEANYRTIFQLILPVAMVWYGWRWLADMGPGIETLQIDPEAPELVASVEQARRTMPTFLRAVQAHRSGAHVKFPLITDSGTTEHIWAEVHHYAGGVFNVSLANSPLSQPEACESRHVVPEAEVEDWLIRRPDGRIQGGFSLRALFEHVERKGIHLNGTMRKERAQFLEAAERSVAADEAQS